MGLARLNVLCRSYAPERLQRGNAVRDCDLNLLVRDMVDGFCCARDLLDEFFSACASC